MMSQSLRWLIFIKVYTFLKRGQGFVRELARSIRFYIYIYIQYKHICNKNGGGYIVDKIRMKLFTRDNREE